MRNNEMKTLMHNYNHTEVSVHRLLKAAALIVALVLSSTPQGTRAGSLRGPNLKNDLSNSGIGPKNLHGPSSKSNKSQTKLQLSEAYRQLPLSFEANRGQVDQQVKFLTHGSGANLFLTDNEAVVSLSKGTEKTRRTRQVQAILRLKLAGSNPRPRVTGVDELPGKTNYFMGNDSSKWLTNIPRYQKVKYEDVYPGVDLVYYGSHGDLEYDFIVAPNADPRQIRLSVEGAQKLSVDTNGDLLIKSGDISIKQHKPHVYQESDGKQTEIASQYTLEQNREVTFELGSYDVSKELIIDPVLAYSTFLGGSEDDHGNAIAVDANGNAYVTGYASSLDFPSSSGYQPALTPFSPAVASPTGQDAFITKFDPSLTGVDSLIYSTYLGGTHNDAGNSIAVDAQGNAYVTGNTRSVDIVNTTVNEAPFPTVNAFQPVLAGAGTMFESCNCQDAFVSKLNADGNVLLYSTYLGGSGTDEGNGIAVDSNGNAYVTGTTHRESGQASGPYFVPFPLRENLQDYTRSGHAFLVSLIRQ